MNDFEHGEMLSDFERVEMIALYVLCLNDMRAGQIENTTPVCWAANEAEMSAFVDSQVVDPYKTHEKWMKSYREGGLLEWYNPAFDSIGQGVQRFLVESTGEVAHLPRV